ncbi:MAG: hypothetical protein JW703_01820 [Candidatus Diapherotrites archaeon]|nr:hypothetical protein [Candidatus Diapherotrites archaeon]
MPKPRKKLPVGFKLGENVFIGKSENHLRTDLKKEFGKVKKRIIKK